MMLKYLEEMMLTIRRYLRRWRRVPRLPPVIRIVIHNDKYDDVPPPPHNPPHNHPSPSFVHITQNRGVGEMIPLNPALIYYAQNFQTPTS